MRFEISEKEKSSESCDVNKRVEDEPVILNLLFQHFFNLMINLI